MPIAETAQLIVDLQLKNGLSAGVSAAKSELGGLAGAAQSSGVHIGSLSTATSALGGALSHAGGQLKGLVTGPLGFLGLTGGLLGVSGMFGSAVKKTEEFGAALEKVQTLTGETALASGALIVQFQKFGLGVDTVSQVAGFAEKTLGKLNETTVKGAAASKSAALSALELRKAELEAAGASTKAVDAQIKRQKAIDQVAASTAPAAASISKLDALDAQFGLHLKDASGKVVDFSTTLSQLAAFYDSSASASTKAYVASQVLGRGYTQMIPILNEGSAGLRQAAADAASLGLSSSDTVAQLAAFHDQAHALDNQMNLLQLSIGTALLPSLIDLTTAATSFVRDNRAGIVDFFKSGAKFAQTMGDAIGHTIVPAFKAIVGIWNSVPPELRTLLIGGFVAQKASSWLFGSGPLDWLKALAGAGRGALSGGAGGAVSGALGVTHVWVDNMGAGGLGGMAGGASGAAGSAEAGIASRLGSAVLKVALVGVATGVAAELWSAFQDQSRQVAQQGQDLVTQARTQAPGMTTAAITQALDSIERQRSGNALNQIALAVTDPFNHGLDNLNATQGQLLAELKRRGVDYTAPAAPSGVGSPHGLMSPKGSAVNSGTATRDTHEELAAVLGAATRDMDKALRPVKDVLAGIRADGINLEAIANRQLNAVDPLHRDFLAQLGVLKTSRDPAAVAAAATRAAADIAKGIGSVATTRGTLAALQKDRAVVLSSGDKGLLAQVDAAIARVEAKVAPREWVAAQLAEARKVAASSETQKQKLADLKRIQDSLLSHSDTAAARTVAAIQATTAAVDGVAGAVGALAYSGWRTDQTVSVTVTSSVRDQTVKTTAWRRMVPKSQAVAT